MSFALGSGRAITSRIFRTAVGNGGSSLIDPSRERRTRMNSASIRPARGRHESYRQHREASARECSNVDANRPTSRGLRVSLMRRLPPWSSANGAEVRIVPRVNVTTGTDTLSRMTPKPRIRLLALDLDGTVLRKDRHPHPASAAAIRAAHEAGVTIAYASGRSSASIARVAEEIGVNGARISLNGALVRDETGKIVSSTRVPQKAGAAIIDYAVANQVHVSMYDEDQVLYAFDSEWGQRYASRVIGARPLIVDPEELKTRMFNKLLLADDAARIPTHAAAMAERLDRADVDPTESEAEYLEFLPAGTNKASGLTKIAESLGITAAETAALGDYLNDREMIAWAGVSGAMGNAHPDLKALASVTVGHHEEGGAAEFIERYVLQP
ncbi:HAD family phosphatase [bacterium]|nr:MAG: HAD family phosphatase [bacterium]